MRSTKVPPLGKNDSLSKNVLLFFLEVITQLLLQRSRHEFLSMALEVEGRRNRNTHRLFSTLESTLEDSVKGLESRYVSCHHHSLIT